MAVVRRLRAGRSPFAADREHLHHRLLRMGNSQREVAIIMYLWTAMFAFPTVIAAFYPLWIAAVVGFAIAFLSVGLIARSYKKVHALPKESKLVSHE
jgi:UDP-GlcNAc:undecaprenyl-phosphate GlcNAc-1-phosphate transferase